ncbi:hypothetical protein COO60DRAFT_227963 [Scenedesmus sp. NREL 46B-D3]|nr:hypothetical protein COO60DRAFT_227963 [Scenedesmus sp. NREL 46B-D3]
MPCSAMLCVDLSEAGQLLLPRTYLQLVGQKLLGCAGATLPVLLSLPEPPPDWLLRGLFTDPFAQALQLALDEVFSNPDGDASPFTPMLQQQAPQLGDFRRVYPACDATAGAAAGAGAGAGAAGSGGSISGVTGRQPSGLLGDGQARGFLWRVGNRALLGVLASIFRDVQEFEAGLLLAATDPCRCRLSKLLTQDLQGVLEGCRQQLHELLSSSTEQLCVNTLEEELVQQPLNDMLQSAAAVTPDICPPVAAAATTPACPQHTKPDCSSSSRPAAASSHSLGDPQSTSPLKKTVEDSSSSSSSYTGFSIFGSNSLMTYDPSSGAWELAAEAARCRHNSSGRWKRTSRSSLTGSSSLHGSCGSRRSATGSKGAAADAAGVFTGPAGPGATSLKPNSASGYGVNSSTMGAAAAAAAGVGGVSEPGAADEGLSQPQQVTQGQQQVLLFAGLVLARRQQFPLLVQDVLVGSIVQALLASMEQMESLFGDPGSSSSLASSSGEDTTAHCCCCISTVLCIQRRLAWLQQDWKPQDGSQQQQQQEQGSQQQAACAQLALLHLAVEKAAALLASLQQHLTQQMQDTLRWAVLEAAAAQPWGCHRPPLRRPGSRKQQQAHEPTGQQQAGSGSGALASPAVRLWHVLLQAWLCVLRRVLPARAAADVLAQVLLQTTQSLVQLYCSLRPSAAWLPVLRQDVAVITTTAWELCQPLQAVAQPQLQQRRHQLGSSVSSSGRLQTCSSSTLLRSWQGQQQQQQQQQVQSGLVGRCQSITEECSAVQQSSGAANLPEDVVCKVAALCKRLVLHSASIDATIAQEADDTAEQQQRPAAMLRPASGSTCTAGAAVDTHNSSWGWLGAELQLMLESRVLGQSLPAGRLVDVTEHAAISTDMDAVEPDAWLQQGAQMLAAGNA